MTLVHGNVTEQAVLENDIGNVTAVPKQYIATRPGIRDHVTYCQVPRPGPI